MNNEFSTNHIYIYIYIYIYIIYYVISELIYDELRFTHIYTHMPRRRNY